MSELSVKPALVFIAALVFFVPANPAGTQTIPKEILGKWVVSRIIPTDAISCWGDAEARKLLHTEIEYSPEFFRWKNIVTKNPVAQARTVTAEQFHNDNSGKGSGSSQVTFPQLGIRSAIGRASIAYRYSENRAAGVTLASLRAIFTKHQLRRRISRHVHHQGRCFNADMRLTRGFFQFLNSVDI